MLSMRILHLRVDDLQVDFKAGINYVVGANGTGKSTLFNCLRYALGVIGTLRFTYFKQVEVVVEFAGEVFCFKRLSDDASLAVWAQDKGGEPVFYRARSIELNDFFIEKLSFSYLFDAQSRSAFEILDFGFLSESGSLNGRQQWDALCAVCGVDNAFLEDFDKEISELKSSVRKNNELQAAVESFSEVLVGMSQAQDFYEKIEGLVERSKVEFFKEFRTAEKLFSDASLKYEEGKLRVENYMLERIGLVDNALADLITQEESSALHFDGVESLVRGSRSMVRSQGEEVFLRFLLVATVMSLPRSSGYNFSGLILNDGFLHSYLDSRKISSAERMLEKVLAGRDDIQYIEFTCNESVPKEKVVLNFNERLRGSGIKGLGWF